MSKTVKVRNVTTSLLGAAAEHYVMCQLLRRGKLAALAPAGMPFADVLVCDEHGNALSAVQVKARTSGADGGWHMSKKHEDLRGGLYQSPKVLTCRQMAHRHDTSSKAQVKTLSGWYYIHTALLILEQNSRLSRSVG